jgi:hypothetical protein
MSDPEALRALATQFSRDQKVAISKWFGNACLRTHNKVFAVLWGRDLAVKLAPEPLAEALKIPGAHLWDPKAKRNPMKEWVQIPADQSSAWSRFAKLAFDYVTTLKESD